MATENAFLDKFGVTVLWNSLKNYINKVMPKKISAFSNDEGYIKGISTLTFTGAQEATFDGKHNVTINIPTPSEEVTPGVTNYNDLTNKPSINGILLSGNKTLSNLGINIPTRVSQLSNDADYLTSSSLTGYVKRTDLTNVAFTGSYNSLTNKPTIPVVPSNVSAFYNDAGYLTTHQDISGKVDYSELNSRLSNIYTKADVDALIDEIQTEGGGEVDLRNYYTKDAADGRFQPIGNYLTSHQDISGKANTADLKAVAFSGSYNDLVGKPTIPDTSNFVALTGDQTIAGNKKFSERIQTIGVQHNNDNARVRTTLWSTDGGTIKILDFLRTYIYDGEYLNNGLGTPSYNDFVHLPELYSTIIIDENKNVYHLDYISTDLNTIRFKNTHVGLSTSLNVVSYIDRTITIVKNDNNMDVGYDVVKEEYSRYSSSVGSSGNYFTITSNASNNKIFFIAKSATSAKTIEWSKDGNTWNQYTAQVGEEVRDSNGVLIEITYDSNDYITLLQDTEQILIRGNNSTYQDNWFSSTALFEVSGNIMSLCNSDSTTFNSYSSLTTSNTFNGLFRNCAYLKSAKNLLLPTAVMTEGCYSTMFRDCTSLTEAPKLPATTMAKSCYSYMFMGCTRLTLAPELPAAIMAPYCYYYMFSSSGLTSAPTLPAKSLSSACYAYMFEGTLITSTPDLPATSVADSCYMGMFMNCALLENGPKSLPGNAPNCYMEMFKGCIMLEEAPTLPSTVANENCYNSMFWGCTSLTEAPELPAIYLRSYSITGGCYASMFRGCSVLKKAPELPATEITKICYMDMFKYCYNLTDGPSILPATDLHESYDNGGGEANSCYRGMFQGCTRLEKAPVLPALILVKDCYREMFDACMALDNIKCLATDISANNCTTNWVGHTEGSTHIGVAATGTFIKGKGVSWTTGDNGIPTGWTSEVDPSQEYLTFNILTAGNITWTMGLSEAVTISYSKNDGSTWTNISTTATIPVSVGDTVLFKGENTAYATVSEKCSFGTSNGATFNVRGNIMSLVHGDDFIGKDTLNTFYGGVDSEGNRNLGWAYTFRWLFEDCEGIRDASNLCLAPTTLSAMCYSSMFEGSGITIAPKILPATNLETLCYLGMFLGCTSLQTAPKLPATTLLRGCYMGMFTDCISLTGTAEQAVVELPATKLAEGCYRNMFSDSGIIISPSLPATTLVNSCYWRMFYNCSSLNQITCDAYYISAEECTDLWVRGVASSGTFIGNTNTNWSTGDNGIPSGWTLSSGSASAKPSGRWWDDEEEGSASPVILTKFKVYTGEPVKDYLTLEILSDGVVKWNVEEESYKRTIQYSFDGKDWTDITSSVEGTPIIVSEGDLVFLKGTAYSYDNNYFSADAMFNLYGNICSLNYGNSYSNSIAADYGFRRLFKGCTTLISAENLSMSAQPTNYCYQEIFKGCTNLVNAPSLSSTLISNGCYAGMFEDCVSLITVPSLPATYVYQYCYNRMFYGCTKLNNIKCLATTLETNATTDWLEGTTINGTFVKNSSATWVTGTSGIPEGWIVEIAAS